MRWLCLFGSWDWHWLGCCTWHWHWLGCCTWHWLELGGEGSIGEVSSRVVELAAIATSSMGRGRWLVSRFVFTGSCCSRWWRLLLLATNVLQRPGPSSWLGRGTVGGWEHVGWEWWLWGGRERGATGWMGAIVHIVPRATGRGGIVLSSCWQKYVLGRLAYV